MVKTGLSFCCREKVKVRERSGDSDIERRATYVDLTEVDVLVRRIRKDLQKIDRSREGVLEGYDGICDARFANVDRERESRPRNQVLVVGRDHRVQLDCGERLLQRRDRSRVRVSLNHSRRVDILDVVLEEQLTSGLSCSTARLVMHCRRNRVLSRHEDQISDVGSSDLLRLEIESKRDVAGSDRDIRGVEQVRVNVDLQVVAVAVVDIEVGYGRRSRIQSLQSEERSRYRERDVIEVESTDSSTGDSCGAVTIRSFVRAKLSVRDVLSAAP